MRYEFHPAALQEYAEAVQFFAEQDRHQDFINTIENAIFQIVGAPDLVSTHTINLMKKFHNIGLDS